MIIYMILLYILYISRATALVPPIPLMGGMAVERKEHGDRIQK